MKHLMLLAAGAAALSLAACDREVRIEKKAEVEHKAVKTVSKLDCPEQQGALKRVSAAADGLSCLYQAEGAEVTLRLTPVANGDVRAALEPIEAELKGLMPDQAAAPHTADDEDSHEGTEITLPGLHIKADDNGAKVRVGGIEVDADDDGAQVRMGREGEVVRSTFILAADEAAAGGYKAVGYEARGAKAGPLVVAVVKAKDRKDDDDLFDDMKALVKRNTDA